jgi:vitamin B12 transporter
MKKKIFIAAAVIISSYAHAQDSTTVKQLDEVVITANKIEQKQSQTGKVITVINQEALKRSAGRTLTEILNSQAGIFINGANNNLGTNQDFYFRGASTGNVLILLDGVPISDPSQINNSYDINNINPAQIERVEILKGAQSTLWGSDAVAGVVNIITKKGGSKAFGANANAAYGSYNTFNGGVGINGKKNKFSYNLNYNLTDSKGFSSAYDSTGTKNFDNDKFNQHTIQAVVGYQINSKFGVQYTANYGKYKAGIDAGAFTNDNDYSIENDNFFNSLSATYKTTKSSLHLTQSFINSNRKLMDDSADIGAFSTRPFAFYNKWARGTYKGATSVTELYGTHVVNKNFSLISGMQYLNQNMSQSYKSISSFGFFEAAPLGQDSTKANNFSFYASALVVNLKGFNIEAGFRVNRNSIYGNNATYTFNPSYSIDEHTKVFLNISSAYKIPSLYQLQSEYGNKDLKPEQSNNYELGVQTFSNNKRNSFRFVGFKRDIKNLIIFYTNPNNFQSNYINRDEQHDYGFEVESSVAIGKNGSLTNNFTYVDGEGRNNNVKTKNLFRRPNFTFNSMLTLQPTKALTIAPTFRFVATRLKGQFDAGPAQMPQYYTIDCYLSYEFAKKITTFIDLRNITNQQYFDVVGYNSRRFNTMVGLKFAL